jgi:predicted kinase
MDASKFEPYAVVFAGLPGTSKSIVAFYLSGEFGLPMFNNDQLRYEVKEDLLADNINRPDALAEFEKRITRRVDELLSTKRPIILDGSVDRRWPERKAQLDKHGYRHFLINMELSPEFIENLWIKTGRQHLIDTYLYPYIPAHQAFLENYRQEINVEINDANFKDRNQVAADTLRAFINEQSTG